MACKADSECSRGRRCVDGECTERIEKKSFTQAAHTYLLDYQAEARSVNAYSQFLQNELEEAAEKREEEAEDIDFWGTVGAVGGGIIGCIATLPGGCVVGATVGAAVGSTIGRTAADYLGDADHPEGGEASAKYGLTTDELNRLDPEDLKFLKEEFWDMRYDAEDIQEGLKEYDDNQWKTHAVNVIDDTWTAFQVASTGTSAWSAFSESKAAAAAASKPAPAGSSFGGGIPELAEQYTLPTMPDFVKTSLDE